MINIEYRLQRLHYGWLLLLVSWLASCRSVPPALTQAITPPAEQVVLQAAASPTTIILPSPTAPPTAELTPPATKTAVSTPRQASISTRTPHPAVAPTLTHTATPPPSSTPNPYAGLTIEALAGRRYGGGLLQIEETLKQDEAFARYLITYPSEGLTTAGYMNVPHEGTKFPVAIVLHGYIDPADYETIAYTRRYADSLAEAGYFVIHPNLRNYPPSDEGPDPFRTGYAIDVLNLIAIIREQSQDITGTLRRADADDINLWGHSMGGGIALRVITVNNQAYLRTAVLYGSMSGDETLNYERIQVWSGGRVGGFELSAPPVMLRAISPIYHLDRIETAVSIHHSESDDVVPVAWSTDLCQRLQALDHPAECFTYSGQPHTFRGQGDVLLMERVISFFDRH